MASKTRFVIPEREFTFKQFCNANPHRLQLILRFFLVQSGCRFTARNGDAKKGDRSFLVYREIPPMASAQKAVQVQIVKDVREAKHDKN
jgi:hypothetical protein